MKNKTKKSAKKADFLLSEKRGNANTKDFYFQNKSLKEQKKKVKEQKINQAK